MSAAENKQLLQDIFTALSQGDSSLFVDRMADDFRWTISGTSAWSRTFEGKNAVLTELFAPLSSQISGNIKLLPLRFIAEDEFVVVQARGENTTKRGAAYNNNYCFVFRLADGKLQEVTEYLDTELVTAALGSPQA